jgi:hypothetical protein
MGTGGPFCSVGEPMGTDLLSSISLPIALLATCFNVGVLLGLVLEPEDGGDMFLPNVGRLTTDYTALYLRIYNY